MFFAQCQLEILLKMSIKQTAIRYQLYKPPSGGYCDREPRGKVAQLTLAFTHAMWHEIVYMFMYLIIWGFRFFFQYELQFFPLFLVWMWYAQTLRAADRTRHNRYTAKVLKDSPDHVHRHLLTLPTTHCFQFIRFSHCVEISEKVLDHEMM